MKPVLTKQDFVRRYSLGEFGNASPTWDSLEEFEKSQRGRRDHMYYHLRNRKAGGTTHYGLTLGEILEHWGYNVLDPSQWYASVMAPHTFTLLQGEVCEMPEFSLTYTTSPLPMREAFVEHRAFDKGLSAILRLKQALNPASYEWLRYLLDAYPGHVVEFSTFDFNWGTVPGYNTVFWEVRNY